MSTAVELRNIRFQYPGSDSWGLQIPDFKIQTGETVFLFGPSGSGKTTLLEMIAGVITPNEGEVHVLKQNLTQMSGADRDRFRGLHIGYVFQIFNLIPYLSVRENILLPLQLHARPEKPYELEALAARLGLSDLLQRSVQKLSVGQQQRVALARALITKPQLLLADEPTSALDSDRREEFIKLLFEIAKEVRASVLFVSHDRTLQKLFSRSLDFSDLRKGSV